MYYWRIWRENRVRFFALLILGLVTCWPVSVIVSADVVAAGYAVGQVPPAELASRFWARGVDVLGIVAGISVYFISLLVGSGGIGEEVERGSAAFLLTRPRSRGYFVWSFWLASAFEVLALTAVTVISAYATLFYLTRHTGPANFLLIGPTLIITGLLGAGLAQLLTTASRRSKNAVAGGIAFTVLYVVVAFVLRVYLRILIPSPVNMYSVNWNAALAVTMAGWLATAVAFIGASHLIVRRMEI